MRYLLHSGNASYDESSKTFTYTLDRRIQDPKSIKITKASYVASSAVASMPPVVYLRSDALSRLCKTKHTVELKNSGHGDGTNVICVLEERHSTGRYSLEGTPRTLPVKMHENVTTIDLYFTDNQTVIGPAASAGVNSAVTDSEVAAIADLKLWIDMREDTLLSSAYANSPNIGDPVRYIYQNAAAESNIFTGYADFDVTVFGAGRGLSSQASWEYAVETAGSNWLSQEDFTLVVAVKMPVNAVSGFNRILNFWWLDIMVRQGLVTITDAAGNYVDSGTGSIQPTKDYMITVRRMDPDGDGTYEMFTRLERLDTNVVVDPGTGTSSGKPVNQQSPYWLSMANEHFLDMTGVLGPLIFFLGTNATEVMNAESWIRNTYAGEDTSGEPATVTDPTFFVELEIPS